MLADEFPEHGALVPPGRGDHRSRLYLQFDDVNTLWRRARAGGATEHRALQDTPYGDREGQIVDPFGYRWGLTQYLRDVSLEEMSRAAAQMFGG